MVSKSDTTFASLPKMEEAHAQLQRGNHREASLLYWDAATSAIDDAAERIGFQLSRRYRYSDVCEMLEPWYPYERTFGVYASLSLLRRNALEHYDFEEVWLRELADDVHELFDMLQFAVSKHDE